jgi:hypothetical protein
MNAKWLGGFLAMWTNAEDEINRTSHNCAMKSYYDRNLFVLKKYVFDRFKLRAAKWISNWCELIPRDKMFIITREGGENLHVFTRAYKSNQRERVLAHVITPQPNKTTTTHQLVKCAMDSLVYRPSSCSIDWFVMQLRVGLKRRRSNKWCDNVFFLVASLPTCVLSPIYSDTFPDKRIRSEMFRDNAWRSS